MEQTYDVMYHVMAYDMTQQAGSCFRLGVVMVENAGISTDDTRACLIKMAETLIHAAWDSDNAHNVYQRVHAARPDSLDPRDLHWDVLATREHYSSWRVTLVPNDMRPPPHSAIPHSSFCVTGQKHEYKGVRVLPDTGALILL